MGESRSDPKTRKLAVMLSALALTPDDALGIYRDRRAADPELDPQDLKRARDILDAIGHAIVDRDRDRWRRLRDASKLLERDAARAPAEGEREPGAARAPTEGESEPGAAAPPAGARAADPPPTAAHAPVPASAPAAKVGPVPPELSAAAPAVRPHTPPTAAGSGPSPWARSAPPTGLMPIAPSPPPVQPAPPPVQPAPAPIQAGAVATGAAPEDGLNATLPIDANVRQALAALPFRKTAPEDLRGVPSLIGDDERDESGQTQHLRSPFRKGKVLPFDTTQEELPARETPAASAPPAPAPQAAVAAPPPQPGYGPSRSDTSLVQLTLEQYAAFCAERTVYPERIADIVARYQLRDEVQAQMLDEIWRARFVDDPALGERYAATYEHYRHWLRKQGR